MRKVVKTKVKAGDVIGVKEKHHTFIGRGYKVESVVVLKVINEFDDNEKEGGDHYPLFTVKVDQDKTWRADTFTHRFFDSIIYK